MSSPAHPDPLRIPADLLPADGRFGSGPSKVPAAALASLGADGAAVMGTSHRQAPVKDLVARAKAGIAALLHLPEGYEVVLGNGGSTTFWDAAVANLVLAKAQTVVCGEFSSKLAAAVTAAPFLAPPSILAAEPGTGAGCNAEVGVDTYCWPQNETSTGVVLPVTRDGLPEDAITLVDATSAAGALDVDVSAADVYYFAPQKVFASDGGLWLATFSPAAIERLHEVRRRDDGRWLPASLDLLIALENSRKDQTYNTPAIATLWLLVEQLEAMLADGGLSAAAARCNDSSARLYDWAERSEHWTPFVEDPRWRSPVVGTVDAVDVDAAAVAKVLRANGVVDVEPYRGLGRNQLRVGMYPAVDPDDVSALTRCVDWVVDHL
ncbi:phosphoserine transaminase [Jatrophihabitans sp. YIM 134969]